jgi:hypothetical protein
VRGKKISSSLFNRVIRRALFFCSLEMGRYGTRVNMSFNESKSKEGEGEVKKKKYKSLDRSSSPVDVGKRMAIFGS